MRDIKSAQKLKSTLSNSKYNTNNNELDSYLLSNSNSDNNQNKILSLNSNSKLYKNDAYDIDREKYASIKRSQTFNSKNSTSLNRLSGINHLTDSNKDLTTTKTYKTTNNKIDNFLSDSLSSLNSDFNNNNNNRKHTYSFNEGIN